MIIYFRAASKKINLNGNKAKAANKKLKPTYKRRPSKFNVFFLANLFLETVGNRNVRKILFKEPLMLIIILEN